MSSSRSGAGTFPTSPRSTSSHNSTSQNGSVGGGGASTRPTWDTGRDSDNTDFDGGMSSGPSFRQVAGARRGSRGYDDRDTDPQAYRQPQSQLQPRPVQPQSQHAAQGQLASLLRSRLDHLEYGADPRDIAGRSSSAPPVQLPSGVLNSRDRPSDSEDNASSDLRADPEYAAYFYSNSRMDPRLPVPVYAPGQSSWKSTWQQPPSLSIASAPIGRAPADGAMWNHRGNQQHSAIIAPQSPRQQSQLRQQQPQQRNSTTILSPLVSGGGNGGGGNAGISNGRSGIFQSLSPPQSPARRKNLVDMIQEDFPRTPSPVFSMQSRQASTTKLGLSTGVSGKNISAVSLEADYAHGGNDGYDQQHDYGVYDAAAYASDGGVLRLSTMTPPPSASGGPRSASLAPARSSSTPPTSAMSGKFRAVADMQQQQRGGSGEYVASPLQSELLRDGSPYEQQHQQHGYSSQQDEMLSAAFMQASLGTTDDDGSAREEERYGRNRQPRYAPAPQLQNMPMKQDKMLSERRPISANQSMSPYYADGAGPAAYSAPSSAVYPPGNGAGLFSPMVDADVWGRGGGRDLGRQQPEEYYYQNNRPNTAGSYSGAPRFSGGSRGGRGGSSRPHSRDRRYNQQQQQQPQQLRQPFNNYDGGYNQQQQQHYPQQHQQQHYQNRQHHGQHQQQQYANGYYGNQEVYYDDPRQNSGPYYNNSGAGNYSGGNSAGGSPYSQRRHGGPNRHGDHPSPPFSRRAAERHAQQPQQPLVAPPQQPVVDAPPSMPAPVTGAISGSVVAVPQRSAILEEFRSAKSRKFELRDVLGHVVEFSGDQHGSRFIQQKLETCTGEDKQLVFEELMPNALQLMTDVFGNYVIQKFFEHGSQAQKSVLAKQMQGHVVSLSLQMYGCRVVQKAVEYVLLDQQAELINELRGSVLKCVKDQNGNHVIQKAIERVPADHIQFLMDAFYGHTYALATHPYGCRVMQRVFEHCSAQQTAPILAELQDFIMDLVQDQYGNYVIQHILEKGKEDDRHIVIVRIKGFLLPLSKHKFASNVIEKCVTAASESERQTLIEEIITTKSDGTTPLMQMMKDQYANYVIQKILDVSSPKQRDLLISQIRPQFSSLRKFTYGKHIIAKVEKIEGGGVSSTAADANDGLADS